MFRLRPTARLTLNNKTLNSEIETLFGCVHTMLEKLPLNNKTLNSEIETIVRLCSSMLEKLPLNNKTLNSEIETENILLLSKSGAVISQ